MVRFTPALELPSEFWVSEVAPPAQPVNISAAEANKTAMDLEEILGTAISSQVDKREAG
jgi:hypothetical protein